jgi:hypothetical protein
MQKQGMPMFANIFNLAVHLFVDAAMLDLF